MSAKVGKGCGRKLLGSFGAAMSAPSVCDTPCIGAKLFSSWLELQQADRLTLLVWIKLKSLSNA